MGKVHFLVHNVPHKEEKDILSCVEFPQNQVFCKMYVFHVALKLGTIQQLKLSEESSSVSPVQTHFIVVR